MADVDIVRIEALVKRYREIASSLVEPQAEMASIKAQIDAEVPVGWKFAVDGVTASKRAPNRTFEIALALAQLDAATKKACIKTSYDQKAVREAAEAAGILESCMYDNPDASPVLKLS